jgi:predicted alpha/beta superfamily hydrolase
MHARARLVFGSLVALALIACGDGDHGVGNGSGGADGNAGATGDANGGANANGDANANANGGPSASGSGNGSGSANGNGTGNAAGPATTTIRVHYPAGSHSISLRASASPWSWDKGATLTAGANDTWTITTTAITAPFEWKPLLDDSTWSLGPNYKASPGATVDVYPHFSQTAGTWSRAYDFMSPSLGNTRGIWIYLPPTYVENALVKMPVVYMHDGQNLFDPTEAFGGNTWKVQQAMDAGAMDGSIAEAIVIGIENTAARIDEYTPVADPTDGGGHGDSYLAMIVTELKPKIDTDLRTLPDRAHTTMIGSSLGGLITAYAGVAHADVFGAIGAMSPSTWWDNDWLVGEIASSPSSPRPLKVYVDSGDSGDSNDDVGDTKLLAAKYGTIGFAAPATLDYVVQAGGQHNEVYWAQRLPGALSFLLGPGR